MKKLYYFFLALFIFCKSFGQEIISNEYYEDGSKVIEKTWVQDNQTLTLVEVVGEEGSDYWYFIDENGIELGLNYYPVKDYGRYYRVDVSIVNNSDSRIDLIIKDLETGVRGSFRNKEKYKNLTFEQYSKIVRRRQNGNAILMGFSTGLAVASGGISYSQSTSSYSGNDAVGNQYSGSTSTYTSTYSPALATVQYQQSQNNINSFSGEQEQRMNYINEGYLKDHTIFPNNTFEGYFLIPFHRKISGLDIVFNIEDMIFDFSKDRFQK